MQKQYIITGMTCGGCVAKVKKAIETVEGVHHAEVKLDAPQATVHFEKAINLSLLKNAIEQAGHYSISELEEPKAHHAHHIEEDLPEPSMGTYKPLILIVAFIFGVSLLVQYPFNDFSAMLWMRYFMAGFFIVFSFFKLLNLEGFASSYRMYDLVAARWKGWGYVYPFVELALGLAYLINLFPLATNIATVVVLGVSSIGAIKSNLDKKKIKCACLGDVFNLPMSTVTIVEDVSMVAMAAVMITV